MPFNKSSMSCTTTKSFWTELAWAFLPPWTSLGPPPTVKDKTGVYGLRCKRTSTTSVFLHAFGGRWSGRQDGFQRPRGRGGAKLHAGSGAHRGSAYHDGYLDEEFNVGNTAMFMATVATIPWVSNDLNGKRPIPGAVQASLVQEPTWPSSPRLRRKSSLQPGAS